MTTAQTAVEIELVFPWTRSDGLAQPLVNEDFWRRVFGVEWSKKCINKTWRRAFGNDVPPTSTGLQAIHLLAHRDGREELFKQFGILTRENDGRVALAGAAWGVLPRERRIRQADLVQVRGKFYLNPTAFAAKLSSGYFTWLSAEDIATNAALFALLQPDDAEKIGRILASAPAAGDYALSGVAPRRRAAIPASLPIPEHPRSTESVAPVSAPVSPGALAVPRHPASEQGSSRNKPRSTHEETAPRSSPAHEASPSKAQVDGIRSIEVISAADAVASLRRQYAEELRDELIASMQRLEAYERTNESLREKIRASSWLPTPLDVETHPANETLQAALERERRVCETLSLLARAIEACEEFCSRLGETAAPPPQWNPKSLGDAATAAETLVNVLRARLDRRLRIEETATALLEDVSGAAGAESVSRVEHLSEEDWGIILEAIERPAITRSAIILAIRESAAFAASVFAMKYACDPAGAGQALARLGLDVRSVVRYTLFLDDGQLQDLARAHPPSTPGVVLALFCRARAANDARLLEYIAPVASASQTGPVASAFVQTLAEAHRRDSTLELGAMLVSGKTAAAERDASIQRATRGVSEMAHQPPGMTGNYFRLRRAVRDRYFKPVVDLVDARRVDDALEAWNAHSPESMIQEASDELRGAGVVEEAHRTQTLRFIAEFDRRMHALVELLRRPATSAPPEIVRALGRLRESTPRDLMAAAFAEVIDRPPVQGQTARLLVRDDRRPSLLDAESLVHPTFVHAWPHHRKSHEVDLAGFVVDLLQRSLGAAPADLAAAIDYYLRREDLAGALAAAEGTELEGPTRKVVDDQVETRRNRDPALLESARVLRDDEYVALCFEGLRDACKLLDLAGIDRALEDLRQATQLASEFRDPKRLRLVEWLTRAGEVGLERQPLSQLEGLASRIREKYADRRLHIDALVATGRALREQEALNLAQRLEALALALDDPQFWPMAEESQDIAAKSETIGRDIVRKYRYRAEEPSWGELADLELEGLLGIVDARIRRGAFVEELDKLATAISEGVPENGIRRLLGAAPRQEAYVPPRAQTASVPVGIAKSPSRILTSSAHMAGSIVQELRREIAQAAMAESIPAGANGTVQLLRQHFATSRLIEARALAARLVQKDGPLADETRLSVHEASYAVARALALDPGDDAYPAAARTAILAPVLAPSSRGVVGRADSSLVSRAIIALHSGTRPAAGDVPTALGAALDDMANDRASDCNRWLGHLMRDAAAIGLDIPADWILAQRIWEDLEGDASFGSRANLLVLLFVHRSIGALRALAALMGELEGMIGGLLTLLERARAEPELRIRIPPLLNALQHNGKGAKNIRPWTQFFGRVYRPATVSDSVALKASIRGDFIETEPDGSAILPIWLECPGDDYPCSLQIEFVEPATRRQVAMSLEEGLLLRDKEVTIKVGKDLIGSSGVVDLPYRITGRTVYGTAIDVRGSWSFNAVPSMVVEALTPLEVRSAWPGHTGDPVSESNFHGRERERKEIQQHLNDSDRQRSVLLMGQRRIGKTSLLLELVSEFPPRPGGLAAVFVDVAGLQASADTLGKSLFAQIVSAIETRPQNLAFREGINKLAGRKVNFELLARKIDPNASIDHSLEALVAALQRESNHHVGRLAILIDEFDRFVSYVLEGGDKQRAVEALTWQLRSIVQGSRAISLVLAGSGLMRLITDDYTSALFGSIKRIEMRPFTLQTERVAIEEIFLPNSIRPRVCRREDFGALVDHASYLTGGHPYFLAVLGHAAAIAMQGRMLTTRGLDRTVADLMAGALERSGAAANARTFYGHVFDTLSGLPKDLSSAAKVILANTAQRTTTEFPRLHVAEALDPPELRKLNLARKRSALEALLREGVLREEGRGASQTVQVAVPLTAAAIRVDFLAIVQRALLELESLNG